LTGLADRRLCVANAVLDGVSGFFSAFAQTEFQAVQIAGLVLLQILWPDCSCCGTRWWRVASELVSTCVATYAHDALPRRPTSWSPWHSTVAIAGFINSRSSSARRRYVAGRLPRPAPFSEAAEKTS
jgi:hypothetical protein